MQEKQATGLDTRARLPLFAAIFVVLTQFLPWFSIPQLKYTGMEVRYTIWNFSQMVENLGTAAGREGGIAMESFSGEAIDGLIRSGRMFQTMAVVFAVLGCTAFLLAWRKRKKVAGVVRGIFLLCTLEMVAVFVEVCWFNHLLDVQIGRKSSFLSLSLESYMQITDWPCALFAVSVAMIGFAGRLLDTTAQPEYGMPTRGKKADQNMTARTKIALLITLTAIPFLIFFGIFFLNDRNEDFISLCIIALAMVPFFLVFEGRRPKARELMVIAVMTALAVVARLAFFMFPQFKPLAAVVIIAGIGLGAEAGFLTGALSGFVSNFFFGQGPWTPWQMFAFGIVGLLGGLIFGKKRGKWKLFRFLTCVYGFVSVLFIYGGLMDTQSVFMSSANFSKEVFLAYYASGLPFNLIHAVCTVIFLALFLEPMLRKLERIQKKYGLIEP